jgi:chromatin remodeling complex protein RSC6
MDDTQPKYEELHSQISETFDNLVNTIYGFKTTLTSLNKQLRDLEKQTQKQFRQMEREIKKRKPKGTRKPSGFAKPTLISDELCEFLNKPSGTELARTEVTQHLISYIKKNNLQKPENKKHITPDNKLSSLLGLKQDDTLTFFNIQGYMNRHFQK